MVGNIVTFLVLTITFSGADFAAASSSWADLYYTAFDISALDDTTLFVNNRGNTIHGFENTPCRDGIFLQSSLWYGIQAGTSVTVNAPILGVCVFVAAGGLHSLLRSDGFTGATWDGFGWRNGQEGHFSQLARYCKSGVSSVTLPPIPEGTIHGICTL